MIDGRNFYDHPTNDLIKQYDEVGKVSTGWGHYYTSGYLLDYAHFKENYRLIAVDLSEKNTDARAIKQIVFQGKAGPTLRLCPNLGKSKETLIEFYKGTSKVLWEYINVWIQ